MLWTQHSVHGRLLFWRRLWLTKFCLVGTETCPLFSRRGHRAIEDAIRAPCNMTTRQLVPSSVSRSITDSGPYKFNSISSTRVKFPARETPIRSTRPWRRTRAKAPGRNLVSHNFTRVDEMLWNLYGPECVFGTGDRWRHELSCCTPPLRSLFHAWPRLESRGQVSVPA